MVEKVPMITLRKAKATMEAATDVSVSQPLGFVVLKILGHSRNK